MKIIHKTTYTVERVTVKEAMRRGTEWSGFMENKYDRPSYLYTLENVEGFMGPKNPRKKIYIVLDECDTCEVVEDK